jgi:hypothetical protein
MLVKGLTISSGAIPQQLIVFIEFMAFFAEGFML